MGSSTSVPPSASRSPPCPVPTCHPGWAGRALLLVLGGSRGEPHHSPSPSSWEGAKKETHRSPEGPGGLAGIRSGSQCPPVAALAFPMSLQVRGDLVTLHLPPRSMPGRARCSSGCWPETGGRSRARCVPRLLCLAPAETPPRPRLRHPPLPLRSHLGVAVPSRCRRLWLQSPSPALLSVNNLINFPSSTSE